MYQDPEFRAICKEVREEFPDLTTEEIMRIVKDQFGFVQKHVKEGGLTPVYLRYLGTFRVKPSRLKWVMERRAIKAAKRNGTDSEQELPTGRDTEAPPEE
jgi:hypothetical protein